MLRCCLPLPEDAEREWHFFVVYPRAPSTFDFSAKVAHGCEKSMTGKHYLPQFGLISIRVPIESHRRR